MSLPELLLQSEMFNPFTFCVVAELWLPDAPLQRVERPGQYTL